MDWDWRFWEAKGHYAMIPGWMMYMGSLGSRGVEIYDEGCV